MGKKMGIPIDINNFLYTISFLLKHQYISLSESYVPTMKLIVLYSREVSQMDFDSHRPFITQEWHILFSFMAKYSTKTLN